MTSPEPKPLLTREDLPLDAIAEICRRWGVLEMNAEGGADGARQRLDRRDVIYTAG